MPKVTVGLPFYDEQQHLGDAIRSVLAQTLTDFELVLVDDGSRDGSLEVARSFVDPRITVVSDGARRHLPARLNEIVRRSSAELVARADADDVMHPTRLARQVAVLESRPSCSVVGTWVMLVDAEGTPFGVVENARLPPTPRSALLHGIVSHATIVGRRGWFQANEYDETLTRSEDRDLWCRTATSTEFAVVPECLYVVRVDVDKRSFVAGYVESQRQNREILARYGPHALGRVETTRRMLAARSKSLVMNLAKRAGLAEHVVRRRGRPPTPAEEALAREALEAAGLEAASAAQRQRL